MTWEELLKRVPDAVKAEWRQHTKGEGWVKLTAKVEASCTIYGVVYGDAGSMGMRRSMGMRGSIPLGFQPCRLFVFPYPPTA